jgi:hypothetical protein
MAMPAFRSPTSLHPEGDGQLATMPSRKETLAIVSTSSKLCGIAAYTAALRRQLGDAYDITVFDLDQYLMRNPHRRVRKLADRHIKDICAAIRRFDVVNLQLEYGTLGRYGTDIYRRFCWLTEAAPRLSVSFHTLLMPPGFDATGFAKALVTCKFKTAARMRADFRRTHLLSRGIARQLRRIQSHKPVSAIVHNRRDLADEFHARANATGRDSVSVRELSGSSTAWIGFSTTRCPIWEQARSRPSAIALRAGDFRCSTICRPMPC